MIRIKSIDRYRSQPLYLKFSLLSIGLLAFFYIIYAGQAIILPFAFAGVAAVLLNPLVNFFIARKINRVVAIFITVFIAVIMLAGLFFFISSQIIQLANAAPQWQERFNSGVSEIVNTVAGTLNVSTKTVDHWMESRIEEAVNISNVFIGQTVYSVSQFVILLFLIPVYIFLILFYKPLLLKFISQLFSVESHGTVIGVLCEVRTLVFSYLAGLLIEAGIMSVLNALTFLIIGLDYALLIGLLNALLNVIPYIGGIIGVVLTMLFALITESPLTALLVLLTHMLIQFIDINFINPKIVGGKVKINALVSIAAVLIGGELCGAPGMFLSIPLVGILKVICDRTEGLRAFGSLLGDTMPAPGVQIFNAVTRTAPEVVSTEKEK